METRKLSPHSTVTPATILAFLATIVAEIGDSVFGDYSRHCGQGLRRGLGFDPTHRFGCVGHSAFSCRQ